MVLACIALQALNKQSDLQDVHAGERLAVLLSQLYAQHVWSVVRKGLLEYLHISKSGGTTFSYIARKSDCEMTPGIGALGELDDVPRWINGSALAEIADGADIPLWTKYGKAARNSSSRSCETRLRLASSRGINYFSNEYTLHGGLKDMRLTHVCSQAVNVVTLRHPAERLLSHLNFMLARIKWRMHGLENSGDPHFYRTFCSNDDHAVWALEHSAPPVADNYIVRSFLGESGFHSPVGGIGEEAVAVARRLLLQFDLVLDLGAGDEAMELVLQQGLGWHPRRSVKHARSAPAVLAALNYSAEECPLGNVMDTLMARQGPDMELYRLGRTIALLDRLIFRLARYLRLRPTLNGLDPPTGAAGSPPDESEAEAADDDDDDAASCGLLNGQVRESFAEAYGIKLHAHTRRS